MTTHVDPLGLASSSGRERRALLEHVRDCAACRRALAEHDPSTLFGLLALTPVPERLLDDLSAEVARRAGNDRSPFGVIAGLAASWPHRAAAAAVLILTLLSGYATVRQPPAEPQPIALSSQRADVEVESGRGVSQVIDLTVGETQIVMVYNGDLKL